VFTVPEIVTPAAGERVMDLQDPTAKMGVTNLLQILVACGGSADGITTYGALKREVADAVVAVLEPLQKAYAGLAADPAYVTGVYADGAATCRQVTAPVLAAAQAAIGLG